MQTSIKQAEVENVVLTIAPAPIEIADPGISEQIRRYRAWLATQAYHDPEEQMRASQEYAARASRIVEVGERRIQTFAPFRYKYSALQTITAKQGSVLIIIALTVVLGLIWDWRQTVVSVMILVSSGYMLHLILDFTLAIKAVRHPAEEHIDNGVIVGLQDAQWPPYTILCPLYREAQVVPQFVKAMQGLDYPEDKLQILFLTETDDAETRTAIRALQLPAHFQIVTVPDGSPRTKPRACNYGLMEATGKYVVIYDAEDVPDPLQLKKAVLTFANHGPNLACIQAKLNFYNPDQNLLTRWFTAEYSLWFDLILPGLQQMKLAIPLGGTSNHFPTLTLRALGGWDGFNVTEDCDLGLRLAWFRLETVVLNSITYEEANSRFKNWIRQRSRWIKGYMQTYLVHMREPEHYIKQRRFREFLSLQLVVGGKAGVLLINPIMWILLLIAIVFRPFISNIYGSLIPLPILVMSIICLVVGNFFYGYIYLLACMKREQYHLVKWMLLIPLYWLMASIAACMALYQLITKPHYWEKTVHGLHLQHDTTLTMLNIEELKNLAVDLPYVPLPEALQDVPIFAPVQKYERLEAVPVASVQDTIEEMIKPQKPAFSTAERTALRHLQEEQRKDFWSVFVFAFACIASVAAYQFYFHQQQILLFADATAHLQIARALVTGTISPHLIQLAGIQPPLPYLVMLPFIWNDALWHSGLAGSLPAMFCYVLTALHVFWLGRRLTHNSPASFIATLLFILNPYMLYLQSTPLSDMLCILTSLMASYYFIAWIQDEKLSYLLYAAGSTLLASLSSYAGWTLFLLLLLLIVGVGLLKHFSWARIEGSLLVFGIGSCMGIVSWLFWWDNFFGSPLVILQTAWMNLTNTPTPYHDVRQAFVATLLLALEILGPILGCLVLGALLVFVLRARFRPDMVATLALFVPLAFSLALMYSGQTLSPSANISSYLYAARIGGALVPVAAIFVATLMSGWRRMTRTSIWSKVIYSITAALIVSQSAFIAVLMNR
jgi:cellulose synthase/poly-beta-1,6-N-acetylglucosamine synthase-like glycosyltransferase